MSEQANTFIYSQTLKIARLARGDSIKALSLYTGIPAALLSKWERQPWHQRIAIPEESMRALSEALNFPAGFFQKPREMWPAIAIC